MRDVLRQGGWVAAFLALLALGLGGVGGGYYLRAAQFDRHGATVTATVTDLDESRRRDSNGTAMRVSYHVTVRYTPPAGGPPQVETRQVGHAFYRTLRPGGPVEVRVLPGRPGAVEIEPGSLRLWGFAFAATGGILAVVALFVFWAMRRLVRKAAVPRS